MLSKVFLLVIFTVIQQNVGGQMLGCYICRDLLQYNYVITTPEYVPYDLVRDCTFTMSQQSCAIKLEIDFDSQQTLVNVTGSSTYVETSIIASASVESGLDHKQYITFWCSDFRGGCNNAQYLKRVLQAVNIEGSFEKLEHLLIPTNETLNSTSCAVFSNTTSKCLPQCYDELAEGCYIDSTMNTDGVSQVCAQCLISANYYLKYSMTFFMEDLMNISDSNNRELSCAVPYCNSIDNLEQISQLVTIDFNATAFVDSTTTTQVPPPTTAPTGTGVSIFRAKDLLKFCFFILLLIRIV